MAFLRFVRCDTYIYRDLLWKNIFFSKMSAVFSYYFRIWPFSADAYCPNYWQFLPRLAISSGFKNILGLLFIVMIGFWLRQAMVLFHFQEKWLWYSILTVVVSAPDLFLTFRQLNMSSQLLKVGLYWLVIVGLTLQSWYLYSLFFLVPLMEGQSGFVATCFL